MKRDSEGILLDWKKRPNRKPILLRGARQVGKTHLVREVGNTFESFAEINFEQSPELKKIFNKDLDPQRILRDLDIALGSNIIPGQTLLFFDEIQDCPNAIKALRYFYEEIPNIHLIAAGSLIDFALEKTGLPVGRISLHYLYPLSFLEFLNARGFSKLRDHIYELSPKNQPDEVIHNQALSLLMEYLAIGGMPEVVASWCKDQNLKECNRLLHSLVETFMQDFEKYASRHKQIAHLNLVMKKIPALLGEKFIYSKISKDLRSREMSPALDLLEKAGIIYRVYHTSANGVPLGAEVNHDRFKIILFDIGITQSLLGLDSGDWIIDSRNALSNKGMLTEAFVGQELVAYHYLQQKPDLYYWHRDKRGSRAEVDYVVAFQKDIVPIEVKSGSAGTLKSLKLFITEKKKALGIRLWHHSYAVSGKIFSFPLYDVLGVNRFIGGQSV